MLMLLFTLGANRYAVSAKDVIEVVPLVPFRSAPKAPTGVVGVFNYRGAVAPAIDLRLALEGAPAQALFSTRILVVNAASDEHQPLGLIVERATDALNLSRPDSQPPGVTTIEAPYLVEIYQHDGEMVQRIDPYLILPETIRDVLYQSLQKNVAL